VQRVRHIADLDHLGHVKAALQTGFRAALPGYEDENKARAEKLCDRLAAH